MRSSTTHGKESQTCDIFGVLHPVDSVGLGLARCGFTSQFCHLQSTQLLGKELTLWNLSFSLRDVANLSWAR